MFIALVDFQTRPEHLMQALAALADEAKSVSAMPGCLVFQALTDPHRPGTICIRHEWDSPGDFAAYVASPSFARSGVALRPLMLGAPVSRRFQAKLLEAA
jgi:quinol monooxygenase YgiN